MDDTIITAATSALGGGALTGFLLKFLISNYVKKSDETLKDLTKENSDFKIKIAMHEKELEELKGIRERVAKLEFLVCDENKGILKDLNSCHDKIRNLQQGVTK
jgi:hypothetical protein